MPSTFIRCNLRLVYAIDIIIGIGIRKWGQHIGTQGVQEQSFWRSGKNDVVRFPGMGKM